MADICIIIFAYMLSYVVQESRLRTYRLCIKSVELQHFTKVLYVIIIIDIIKSVNHVNL